MFFCDSAWMASDGDVRLKILCSAEAEVVGLGLRFAERLESRR
jgi:hypothetical protein